MAGPFLFAGFAGITNRAGFLLSHPCRKSTAWMGHPVSSCFRVPGSLFPALLLHQDAGGGIGAVCDGERDDRQGWSRGQVLDDAVVEQDGVFRLAATDAGVPGKDLIVDHNLSAVGRGDPVALAIPGSAALVVEALLAGVTGIRKRSLGDLVQTC